MKVLKTLFVIALFFASTQVNAAEHSAAQQVVDHLHETLLKAMTEADTLGFKGRVELLGPVITASFDFKTIARIVTGRYWKDITEEQRSKFIAAFEALSTATYASNFSGFSGERFETVATEEKGATTILKTVLIKSNGEKVSLNYLLHNDDGQWRIVNVIAQGVSDLSLKRADYTVIIKAEGFDSLIERLHQKTAEMSDAS